MLSIFETCLSYFVAHCTAWLTQAHWLCGAYWWWQCTMKCCSSMLFNFPSLSLSLSLPYLFSSLVSGVGELDQQDQLSPQHTLSPAPPSPSSSLAVTNCPYLLLDVRDRECYEKCHIVTGIHHTCTYSHTHSHSLTHLLTYSLHSSLTHPLTHSLTHPHTHSLPLTHPLTHSLIHSLTTHPLTHSFTHPLTHSLPHSLTHSHTHSLTTNCCFYVYFLAQSYPSTLLCKSCNYFTREMYEYVSLKPLTHTYTHTHWLKVVTSNVHCVLPELLSHSVTNQGRSF